jgi:hypothetical protein
MRYQFPTLLAAVGAAVLIFGFFCLNYTKAGTIERHREFSDRHSLPQPSGSIFYGGVLAVAAGAGAVGYTLGVRSSR